LGTPPSNPAETVFSSRGLVSLLLITLFLTGICGVVFGQVLDFQFVDIDDSRFITENPHLRGGLSLPGIRWALTADLTFDSPHADFWLPVTYFSRLLDVQLFGFNPRGHHGVNLELHIFNVLFLFLLLRRLTGETLKSAFAAALFAVHPLQVSPVAWISARKDVLSMFFGLSSAHAYVAFVRHRKKTDYAACLALFGLSLMSKPMMVTFPCLLLILDYWPLRRFQDKTPWRAAKTAVSEKWPFFFMSLAVGLVTFFGGGENVRRVPYAFEPLRIIKHYGEYLLRFVYPHGLTVYGPTPLQPVSWKSTALTLAAMAVLTLMAVSMRKQNRAWLAGWAWFLIALLPVSGVLWPEDRFMYLPMIGLLMAVVWGLGSARWNSKMVVTGITGTGLFLLIAFMDLAFVHTGYWENSMTLNHRMAEVNPDNYVALNNLGMAYMQRGILGLLEASQHRHVHGERTVGAFYGGQ